MTITRIARGKLIFAAQTGDAAAIGHLLTVCQSDGRRNARRHCQARDPDDAVQESLMVISRKVHGLQAAAAISSWLFTVIKCECRQLERELTIAEIAERLGEQPGAIKSRLHRARELVREYMVGPQAVAKSPKGAKEQATASATSLKR